MPATADSILSAVNENNSLLHEIISTQTTISSNIKDNSNRIFVTDEKIDQLETLLDFMSITIENIKELVQESNKSDTSLTVEDFME